MTTKEILTTLEISKSTYYKWIKESEDKTMKDFIEALYLTTKFNLQVKDINLLTIILEPKFKPKKGEDRDMYFQEFLERQRKKKHMIDIKKKKGQKLKEFFSNKKYTKTEQALLLYALNLNTKQKEALETIFREEENVN